MAPSHYLTQCWLNIIGIHPSAISQKMCKTCWKKISNQSYLFNSLWPGDTIWRHRSGSTLAQVMACCLMAPSHYLNQCWLITCETLWHSPEGNFTGNAQGIFPWYEFENYFSKITATSPWGQWVKIAMDQPGDTELRKKELNHCSIFTFSMSSAASSSFLTRSLMDVAAL